MLARHYVSVKPAELYGSRHARAVSIMFIKPDRWLTQVARR